MQRDTRVSNAPAPAHHTSARDLIDSVLDPGSNVSWDTPPEYGQISEEYRAQLERARARSGADEAVLTGSGTVNGIQVAYVVSEFGFLGGSIGAATARRIVAGIERATREGLPLLVSPSSGGTRMQEGTPAFAMMVSITAAVTRHKDARLPFLVYLRNPTTGGVMASWGSSGHFTFAEPGALLGFLGPRVVEIVSGEPLAPHVQTAENLTAHGVIDGVIPIQKLKPSVYKIVRVMLPGTPTHHEKLATGRIATKPLRSEPIPVWDSILLTRDSQRPGAGDIIDMLAHPGGLRSQDPEFTIDASGAAAVVDLEAPEPHLPCTAGVEGPINTNNNVIELSGTGDGRHGPAVRVVLARIDHQPVVIIGQERRRQPPLGTHQLGPAALRFARRGIALAQQLGVPLISIIDTPGAELSQAAEEGGMAGSIARTLGELVDVDVPTISVILGEGCGGGALAMLPADKVLCAENGWLSPLPPEGASAIMYHDDSHAPEMMEQQGVGARALLSAGIVDSIIPEPYDARSNHAEFVGDVIGSIAEAIWELNHEPTRVGRDQRFAHYLGLLNLGIGEH